ncbi:DUF2690 domain-containing protein [Streptomyces sp. NPDC005820]|uniref:DUF2690 domain-containing protein n=1 Tax=Streptomyces sp. NPDC005820 TaxID=3157069 RepID=UPI0033D30561
MKLRNWAAATSVLLVAATGVALAPPAGAAADASCYGSSCEGKDPATYCADDAITPSGGAVWLGTAYLELRYSPSCRAAWARISRAGYNTLDQSTPYAIVHRTSDGREYKCTVATSGTGCYTKMVNDIDVTSYAKGMWDSGSRVYEDRTSAY